MSDSSANRSKPRSYFEQARPELVARLPDSLGRLLDVGCGAGGVGRALRARADFVAGIELDEEMATAARAEYDQVLVGRVEDVVGEADGPFDTILAYDLLEHLPEPESVLRRLRDIASEGALLHVSVPNARHWSLLRDLAVRGTFGYTEWGHRDRTHLRWVTRRDLVELLEGSGWLVERTLHAPLTPVGRLAERLTGGRSAEFLVYQWSALARREPLESGSADTESGSV
jgi:2-polyprenyl-3-methyl-5-hydroxy-6-metoxy-1,4-benzoquinol methylase